MSLDKVIGATSVAVVGASKNETKRGFQALRTLIDQGFDGPIYPVNPREKRILGLRCYEKVSDIEGPCDLALITTPAKTLTAILEDCGKKGIAGAVIIAGGFGEAGAAGRSLEDEVVRVAREQNIRLVGPNTSGMINFHTKLDLVGLGHVRAGSIALLSQSGNMALTVMTEGMIKSRLGFSTYVGVGNEADLHFHEYLAYLRDDPNTSAIVMYVEGMRDGRRFLQQAYETTRQKPIILLKSGRTASGARSVGSHTGALAGISAVARSAFKRAGIIVVDHSDELFPAAEALASLPKGRHNSVAILADGGGHATIAADYLTDLGVELPELAEKTQKKLREILPSAAAARNPVDVAGGADDNPLILAKCAKILLQDAQIGSVLLVGLFGGYGIRFAEKLAIVEEDAAHRMGRLVRDSKKPIVVHSLYSYAKPHALDLLRYYGIPVYDSLEIASKCIGVLAERGEHLATNEAKTSFGLHWGERSKSRGRAIIVGARTDGRGSLLEHEAQELLAIHGADVARGTLASSASEAVAAYRKLEGPVAMKVVSPQILHKSEAGGVELNLTSGTKVREAYHRILEGAHGYAPTADIRGVLVSPMAKPGLEVIVGTKLDEQFGPVILFGIGGVMVEVLKDVSFRVLPISHRSAKMMIDEIEASTLLDGYRGKPPVDKRALRRLLLVAAEVMEAYPDIAEMDLNPVIVNDEGLTVVDARIILRDTDMEERTSASWAIPQDDDI